VSTAVALIIRMLVSLAVVLALMYVAARLIDRTRGGSRPRRRPARGSSAVRPGRSVSQSRDLEIVGHRPLGKGASVALVQAADRTWLIGVTETSVRLLSEIPPEADSASDDASPAGVTSLVSTTPTPVTLLDQLRERTVRRA
jgi:flagellar biogenesis protein FliO